MFYQVNLESSKLTILGVPLSTKHNFKVLMKAFLLPNDNTYIVFT